MPETLYPNDAKYNSLLEETEYPDLDFQEHALLDALRGKQPADAPQLQALREYVSKKIQDLLGKQSRPASSNVLCLSGDDNFDEAAKEAGLNSTRRGPMDIAKELGDVLDKLMSPQSLFDSSSSYHEDLLRTLYVLMMRVEVDTFTSVLSAVRCALQLERQEISDGKDLRLSAVPRLEELLISSKNLEVVREFMRNVARAVGENSVSYQNLKQMERNLMQNSNFYSAPSS